MDRERVLSHRTVVVRGDRIAAILPRDAVLPPGTQVVEGGGTAYLIPGLADLHVHLLDRRELPLYLANGITTVRNLHGLPRHLAWRDSIARGTLVGPRLVTSGPILDGEPPTRSTNTVVRSPPEAERAVAAQRAQGYDLIKLYDNVSPEVYRAILRSARRHRMSVAGHLPTSVGLERVVAERGQHSLEHVEELLPLFDDGRDTTGLAAAAGALARAGIWVVPTLTVHQSALDQARDWPGDRRRPELAYLHPETAERWGWTDAGEARSGSAAALERFERTTAFFRGALVPALHRAGVRLLAGSDAPVPTIVPGFGLGRELRLLVDAGLTPWEALLTATRYPAEFLGRGGEAGTLAPGRAADLVLLAANPLESIANVERPMGVMIMGRWYARHELDNMLDAARAGRPESPRSVFGELSRR